MSAPAEQSFYWFDYETFGRSPRYDRPAQFAGLRTDLELNPIGEADAFYCRLAGDYLPEPAACRITGITPDRVQREGLSEADFIGRALAHLGAPGTCSVGYNSVRFDDEFTRHTLFRNLTDPYAQEYRDGASRWDLIDVVRFTRALRPDGISWPTGDDGQPNNTLEALAAANGIGHANAHDALSDVEATLGLARLIRSRQPRLFDYLLEHRTKSAAATLLNTRDRQPLLIGSTRVPREREHLGVIVPICRHPERANEVIVADLHEPPESWLDLDDDALRERLYARREELGKRTRPGLFGVRINACPVLAPFKTLRPVDAERLGFDCERLLEHRDQLVARLDADGLRRIGQLMVREWPAGETDVDGSLYGGPFLSDADRRRLEALRQAGPGAVALDTRFDDDRLEEQVFRYRARNCPDALDEHDRARWQAFRRERLSRADAPWLDFDRFDAAMRAIEWPPAEADLKASLTRYRTELEASLGSR